MNSLFSTIQIVAEYDRVLASGGGDKLVKSWKTSKAWKIAKVINLEEPSFLTFNSRLVFTEIV